MYEGRDFIGIEQSAEYLEIAERRIAHAEAGGGTTPTKRSTEGQKVYGKYGYSLPRCPEHDAPKPSSKDVTAGNSTTYICGCPIVRGQPFPDEQPKPRTLPLFGEVADK